MLAWLLTARSARWLTAITLVVYSGLAVIAGFALLQLGITRSPTAWAEGASPLLAVSIFPGFLVAFAWAQGRATSDRQPPQSFWWPSRAGRADEFPLYIFGKAMPAPLKVACTALLAAVAASAITTFAVLTLSLSQAPPAAQTAAAQCRYPFTNHGTHLCITAAQAAAAQAAFPVVVLGFDLVICTVCAGGLLEQRSDSVRALRHPDSTAS